MHNLLTGKIQGPPNTATTGRELTSAEHRTAMRRLLDLASNDGYRNAPTLLAAAHVHAEAAKSAPADPPICYTADAVVFAKQDDTPVVLLILRSATSDAYPGHWALPGGYVNAGETSFAAAYRELLEETGINLYEQGASLRPTGIYDAPDRDPRGRVISVAYTAQLPAPVEVQGADDADRAKWVPLDKALADDLAFDHNLILANAAGQLPQPASPPSDGDAV